MSRWQGKSTGVTVQGSAGHPAADSVMGSEAGPQQVNKVAGVRYRGSKKSVPQVHASSGIGVLVMRSAATSGAVAQEYALYRADVSRQHRWLTMMRAEELLVLRPDRLVAFARHAPQQLHVGDVDLPAAITDDAGLLERMRHDRDGVALDADHACKQFLRQRKPGAIMQITCAQQPARQARLDRMGGVAGRRLLDLSQQCLFMSGKQAA